MAFDLDQDVYEFQVLLRKVTTLENEMIQAQREIKQMKEEDVELRKQLWEQNQMIIELQKQILEYQVAMQNLMNQHDFFKD